MARRLSLLSACMALGAPLAQADGGWGGWSMNDVMDAVNDAGSKMKEEGGKAIGSAKVKACGEKMKYDISTANKTMNDQLNSDCESAASKVSFVHDHALELCLNVGRGQIARTLEDQAKSLEKSCLEALEETPGNWQNSLKEWADSSKNTIDTSLGSAVEDAMAKAKDMNADAERLYSSNAPFFREGALRIGTIAVTGAAAMAMVAAAAAAAFRLRRSHLAVEASPILGEAGAAPADLES